MRIDGIIIAACVAVLPACSANPVGNEALQQPLRPLLAGIQDTVAAAEEPPMDYYKKKYRPEEPLRWSKVAAWIVEDAIARNYPEPHPTSRILDLGCGYGTLLAFATTIYGVEGICMDVTPLVAVTELLRKDHPISFVQGNIETDPLPEPGGFDVIIMTEVLEHLNHQPVPTLRKIHKALSETGSFFLSTPDADQGWGRQHTYYRRLEEIPFLKEGSSSLIDDHIWHYTRDELTRVLAEAGFAIKTLERSRSLGGDHFNVWAVKQQEPPSRAPQP